MSWTKREFVVAAFEEIGIADYVFDLQPEQLDSALRKLDSMMAQWQSDRIGVGYYLSSQPDLDEDSRAPSFANEAIYLNLALRLAGSMGKSVTAELKQNAKEAKDSLLRSIVQIPKMHLPDTLPSGAGNKYFNNYIFKEKSNAVTGLKNDVEFLNDL